MAKEKKWTMPAWMLHCIPIIVGVDSEEQLVEYMNDKTAVQVNAPRAMIAVSVKAQVGVLNRLHLKGIIG